MLEERRLHLFAKQFLVNQAVEDGTPIIVGELVERAAVEQGFVTERFVPIALQNDVPVDGGDDAVDHLRRAGRREE